jgi:cyclopropane fatty-acyl-phospholipid synthase-like methyltransferase
VHHWRAAYRAWRSYRGSGLRVRLFLAARLLVLPLKPLALEFAQLHGHVLGLGSGHGLIARWVAELNPDVTIDGYDVDAERVAIAAATQERQPRVRIHREDVLALRPEEAFDSASAVDLIHHLDPVRLGELAAGLSRAVKPGGTLVIKDIAPTPRWKHAVNRLHDRLVAGEPTTAIDLEALAELVTAAGFDIERLERVGRLSPYPHFILRARRRA